MQSFDVCNGDADGLIARQQFRLAFPVPTSQLTLITGVKRETTLLSRVDIRVIAGNPVDISVFDISYDQNADSANALLQAGAAIRYFDHHRASQLRPNPRLSVHIDTSPDTCTSLIVDRHLDGAHRTWAIAAAFGDNLIGIAEQLASDAGLSTAQAGSLRQLGECLNYNAYGESISDLHYSPYEIAHRMSPFRSPFDFAEREDIVANLRISYADDMQHARALLPIHASNVAAIFLLPEKRWARRVGGMFANELVWTHPRRAHAVLSPSSTGTFTVSIRAPQVNPRSADAIAIQFDHGGGRAAAAGIEDMADEDIARLISILEKVYGAI